MKKELCVYASVHEVIIDSDNGSLLNWYQVITWINDDILCIRHLETNFNEIQ